MFRSGLRSGCRDSNDRVGPLRRAAYEIATMLHKLIVIITALGATSAALLVNRQQRIEVAHEMAVLHARLHEHDRTLWRMESEIAGRCRPERLRHAMDQSKVVWSPMQHGPRTASNRALHVAVVDTDSRNRPGG